MIDEQGARLAGIVLAQAAAQHAAGDTRPFAYCQTVGSVEAFAFTALGTPDDLDEACRVAAGRTVASGRAVVVVLSRQEFADGIREALVAHVVTPGPVREGTVTQVIESGRRSLVPGRSRPFRTIGEPVISEESQDEVRRRAVIQSILRHADAAALFPQLVSARLWGSTDLGAPKGIEGVYSGALLGRGERLHYVLDGATRTLCGRSLVDRFRYASSWSFIPAEDRCARCDPKVGPRGAERHGEVTEYDMVLFGVEPPITMRPEMGDWYRQMYAKHVRALEAERNPEPPTSMESWRLEPGVTLPPTLDDMTLRGGGDDLDTGIVPTIRLSLVRYGGGERLAEGVYYQIGQRVAHYVLDSANAPLCGPLPGARLYRRLDAWYIAAEGERCTACAPLVGERGDRRHGWATSPGASDHDLYRRSRAEWDRQMQVRRDHLGRLRIPSLVETDFPEPPFVLIEDPAINRLRSGEENRVRNDVYAKSPHGKKWHRVYAVDWPSPDMARYGRGLIYPCGNANSEFEPQDGWYFYPITIREGVPPEAERCKACAASDRRYGKGKIMDRARWDR